MSKELIVDINRTGFPVKFGSLELWFDSSIENLRRFFDIENIAQEKLKEIQDKAQHIHFPEEVVVEDLETETVDAAFDVEKEFLAVQYDILFGDGTFKKLYKQYPDFLALENALEGVGKGIAERIDELEAERKKVTESIKSEYLQKKQAKAGD